MITEHRITYTNPHLSCSLCYTPTVGKWWPSADTHTYTHARMHGREHTHMSTNIITLFRIHIFRHSFNVSLFKFLPVIYRLYVHLSFSVCMFLFLPTSQHDYLHSNNYLLFLLSFFRAPTVTISLTRGCQTCPRSSRIKWDLSLPGNFWWATCFMNQIGLPCFLYLFNC